MQRVNFFLQLCFLTTFMVTISAFESFGARNYIPARKIAKKAAVDELPPGVERASPFTKPPVPLSQASKTSNSYAPLREASSYFKKQLAGPYIGVGIGVQMHRHEGKANDAAPQTHDFNTNKQGFGAEVSVGWVLGLANSFFAGLEAGISPIPVSTKMRISDGTTTISIKGELGYTLAALLGKHFNGGGSLAYIRLGAEWRKFSVKHEVEDGIIDDIDDSKVVMGWSPGIGIGFLLFDYVYTIAEFRTTFYEKFTFKSPKGRLKLDDKSPRVDMFLLKFILPLNNCFGTRYGMCMG